MKSRVGMWQLVQLAPAEAGLWKWCAGVSNFSVAWQPAHTRSAEPETFRLCGLWQSEQLTPAACILLWRNDPYSKTSSWICPSAW